MKAKDGDAGQHASPQSRRAIDPCQVADIGDDTITLDANHPLAAETLVFDVELIDIT